VLVDLDRDLPLPLSVQLATQLSDAIRRGSLREGATLPASRTLALQLGVSRGVVTAAYSQLSTQGYLVMQQRSVPRVAALPSTAPSTEREEAAPTPLVDFTMLSPDLGLVPRRDWRRVLEHAIRVSPAQVLDYGDPRGQLELREALVDFLGRTRGVVSSPSRVIVCQGSLQSLDIACQLLASRGAARVALEDPCAAEIRTAVRRAGLRPVQIPVDAEGIRVDLLAAEAPDAALLTPAHQFPTGSVLSERRRADLVDWLVRTGAQLVEDDYDAEFRYGTPAVPTLQEKAPDRVMYAGSASKTFAPGLRLGWLVVPESAADAAGRIKWSLDGGSPGLEQVAFARLVTSGAFERHLLRARVEYRKRREALEAALAGALPRTRVEGGTGGLHLTLRLDRPVDIGALDAAASRQRVRVQAVESFLHEPAKRAERLVLGFARLHPSSSAHAAASLATVLQLAGGA